MRPRLLRPDSFSSALARLIAATFGDDAFILLLGEDDAARLQLLGRAAAELATLRCRVLRVTAPPAGELSVGDLVRQVADQAVAGEGTGDLLERSHRLLTELGSQFDRVLLLIHHAQSLSSSAVRLLQLTSRSGPNLRIVLATTPAGAVHPAAPEFKLLSSRSATISLDRQGALSERPATSCRASVDSAV